MTCADELDDALGPLRRVRRRVQATAASGCAATPTSCSARLLARIAQRDDDEAYGEEAIELLVDAAGRLRRVRRPPPLPPVPAGAGPEHRRARAGPAEALHWLEAYRADTGRAHSRGREMWAEMFVRRSRLREAERQAARAPPARPRGPAHRAGQPAQRRAPAGRRCAWARSRCRWPSSTSTGSRRSTTSASHTHGDAVLRRVADLLREHSRTGDEVYRWAGDEFLVVLPTATEAQAVVVMERLRAAVAAADWSDLQLPEPVTVSIGVATAPARSTSGEPAAVVGWRALFDTADLHLFSAKRSGRNRVRAPGGTPTGDDEAGGVTALRAWDDVGRVGLGTARSRARARQRHGRRAQCAGATRSPASSGDRCPGELAARRRRGTARRRRAASPRPTRPPTRPADAPDDAPVPRPRLGRHPARRAARPPAAHRRLHAGRRPGRPAARRVRPSRPSTCTPASPS